MCVRVCVCVCVCVCVYVCVCVSDFRNQKGRNRFEDIFIDETVILKLDGS